MPKNDEDLLQENLALKKEIAILKAQNGALIAQKYSRNHERFHSILGSSAQIKISSIDTPPISSSNTGQKTIDYNPDGFPSTSKSPKTTDYSAYPRFSYPGEIKQTNSDDTLNTKGWRQHIICETAKTPSGREF